MRAVSTARSFTLRQVESIDFLDNDEIAMICQISRAMSNDNTHRCDLCGNQDHLLISCPDLTSWKDNPAKCRRMLSALRGMHPQFATPPRMAGPSRPRFQRPPATRAGTPPASNRTIRSITHDDDTDHDDTTLEDTDNEGSLADTDDEDPDLQ